MNSGLSTVNFLTFKASEFARTKDLSIALLLCTTPVVYLSRFHWGWHTEGVRIRFLPNDFASNSISSVTTVKSRGLAIFIGVVLVIRKDLLP